MTCILFEGISAGSTVKVKLPPESTVASIGPLMNPSCIFGQAVMCAGNDPGGSPFHDPLSMSSQGPRIGLPLLGPFAVLYRSGTPRLWANSTHQTPFGTLGGSSSSGTMLNFVSIIELVSTDAPRYVTDQISSGIRLVS